MNTKTTRRTTIIAAAIVVAAWANVSVSAATPSARDCTPTAKSATTKTMKGDVRAALEDRAIAPMKRLTGDKTPMTMTA
jgi:hypothetical protein